MSCRTSQPMKKQSVTYSLMNTVVRIDALILGGLKGWFHLCCPFTHFLLAII